MGLTLKLPSILLIAIVAAASPRAGPAARTGEPPLPADWTVESWRWSGAVGDAARLVIRNRFGDLRVRPSEDDRVFLSALIQRHRDDPRRAAVERRHEGEEFRIEVGYPGTRAADLASVPEAWRRRRVDVTLYVPKDRELELESAGGELEVRGHLGGVEVRSVSGEVVVSARGPVTASSERGALRVRFESTAWSRPSILETQTGDISVWLPAPAACVARLETFGELTTDWSLEVERLPETDKKRARAIIGAGGPELFLSSDRGNLKLLRSSSGIDPDPSDRP